MRLEPLESRIAPAALAGGKLTYTDVDNDLVTITFSKKTGLGEDDFVFDPPFATGGPQKLLSIELEDDAGLKGTNITMKVAKVGDGFADVGAIAASGVDLGTIKLLGDLRKIDAGSGAEKSTALKGLSVRSFGLQGEALATIPGVAITAGLISTLNGKFGKIAIAGDFAHATFNVFEVTGLAKSASFTVGGKLVGGEGGGEGVLNLGNVTTIKLGGIVGAQLVDPAGTFGAFGGVLQANTVGTLTITGDVEGGNFSRAGAVEISGKAGKIVIQGKVKGGHGSKAGYVSAGDTGTVSVGGLIGGNLTGPGDFVAGGLSGALQFGSVGTLTVLDGILGGSIGLAGQISTLGAVKKLTITGDVTGSGGADSGSVRIEGKLTTLKVTGSIAGGTANGSGLIKAVEIGTATIMGDLTGTDAVPDLPGGAFGITGGIEASRVGTLKITGSILGGDGRTEAGKVRIGELKNFTLTGSLEGGALEESGMLDFDKVSGTILIKGGLKGGAGESSGALRFEGEKQVRIGGVLEGGAGAFSGTLLASGNAPSVMAGGLKAGVGEFSGSVVNPGGNFKSVIVTGDVVGLPTNAAHIAAGGGSPGLALGSVTINGKLEHGRITAGLFGTVRISPDVAIGKVTIGKEFVSSVIAAGIDPRGDFFADGTDAAIDGGGDPAITSKIASVLIKGTVAGTLDPTTDSFGIVAQEVGKVTVGKQVAGLTKGAGNDTAGILLGGTLDVQVREVA